MSGKSVNLVPLLWTVFAAAAISVEIAVGFNIDVTRPIIFEDPGIGGGWNGRPSYFGFSVALHNFTDENDPTTWLLVGAPRGNRSKEAMDAEFYPGGPEPEGENRVIEPGVLYKCSLWSGNDACKEVVLDTTGNVARTSATSFGAPVATTRELKDNGWLGVSLDAQPKDDGRVVVCGHLWKQQIDNNGVPDFYATNGICYWTLARFVSHRGQVGKLTPLDDNSMQTIKVGKQSEFVYVLGQMGQSAHFPKNVSELVLGAPGVYSWRGSVVRLSDAVISSVDYAPSRRRRRSAFMEAAAADGEEHFGAELLVDHDADGDADAETRRPSLQRTKRQTTDPLRTVNVPDLRSTPGISTNSYFGYAVSSGIFSPDRKTSYVAGAPHASMEGRVFIFNYPRGDHNPLDVLWTFNGAQLGEFFGAAVCALDVNGDGVDDLVVGAPLHASREAGGIVPDHGRIAVYLNSESGFVSEASQEFYGSKRPMARFGTTLSAIGDLNRDGFEDLAVGAPFDDEIGVVYVYYGSKEGLSDSPQVIAGSALSTKLKGFGFSVSRGVDMDQNKYPDIAIGAFESGHAVVLRTSPVARIAGSLTADPPRLNISASEFNLIACLEYSGHDVALRQEVVVTVTVDASRASPRAEILNATSNSGENVAGGDRGPNYNAKSTLTFKTQLEKGIQACNVVQLQVLPGVKDFSKAIDVAMEYRLPRKMETFGRSASLTAARPIWITNDEEDANGVVGRPKRQIDVVDFCKSCVMLDPMSETKVTEKVPFLNGCGADDLCATELSIEAHWADVELPLVIGSRSSVKIAVTVNSSNEPAFDPVVGVVLPRELPLLFLPTNCRAADLSADDRTSLECQLPGPLTYGQTAKLELEVTLDKLHPLMTELEANFTISAIGVEHNSSDNAFRLALPLIAKADIGVTGEAVSREYFYTRNADLPKEKKDKSNLVSVVQNFQIVKHYDTPVNQVHATFVFPYAFVEPQGSSSFLEYSLAGISGVRKPDCRRVDDLPEKDSARAKRDAGDSLGVGGAVLEGSRSESVVVGEAHFSSLLATSNFTMEMNCSSGLFYCFRVSCPLGPFDKSGSAVDLAFELKMDMSVIEPLLENKTTVLLKTEAFVRFGEDLKPIDGMLNSYDDRSDFTVVKTYLSPAASSAKEVPLLWIALAIAGGILILVLIVAGLIKAGFFKRSKLREMQDMKAEEALLSQHNGNNGHSGSRGSLSDDGVIDTGGSIVIT